MFRNQHRYNTRFEGRADNVVYGVVLAVMLGFQIMLVLGIGGVFADSPEADQVAPEAAAPSASARG